MSAWKTGFPEEHVVVVAETEDDNTIVCSMGMRKMTLCDDQNYDGLKWEKAIRRWCEVSEMKRIVEAAE